jgi:hypothetical protein
MEMMWRIWRQPALWRERGVSAEEAHRHSNVELGRPLSSWPGSPVQDYSRPPIGPPSAD